MQREQWMTDQQFADIYAISEAAPGPSSMISSLVGYKAAGLPGGVGERRLRRPTNQPVTASDSGCSQISCVRSSNGSLSSGSPTSVEVVAFGTGSRVQQEHRRFYLGDMSWYQSSSPRALGCQLRAELV